MQLKSNFLPGDEWLYYKIYMGQGYSNKFLSDTLLPILELHIENDKIPQWFFVRFRDPEHHLRIRLFCKGSKARMDTIESMAKICSRLMSEGYLSEVEIGTYKREITRYGDKNIELIEKLWSLESNYTLSSILEHKNGVSHVLSIIQVTDAYLKLFYSEDQQIIEHVYQNFESLNRLFNVESKKLSKKYRMISNEIESLLRSNSVCNSTNLVEGTIFHQITSIMEQLDKLASSNLISSLIHMLINRGFDRSQKHMEMVIYHHLWKYYQSNLARFGKI